MPFYVRNLCSWGCGYRQGSWKQSPADTEGQLQLSFGGVKSYMRIFACAGVSAPNPCVVQESTALWERAWPFFEKLNMHLPYGPATPLPGVYPREMKACVHSDLYSNAHRGFICNRQKLETTQCPSAGEWVNKLVCPRDGILLTLLSYHKEHSADTCHNMNCKISMLSNRIFLKRVIHCMILFT